MKTETAWKIPLFKIYYDEDDVKAVTESIRAEMNWTTCPNAGKSEEMIADYVGAEYAATFNSWTSALHDSPLAHGRWNDRSMYQLIKDEPEFEIVGFTPEIMEEVMHTKIPEIHDRIIVATAKFYRAGLLTKDKIILESGEVEQLW